MTAFIEEQNEEQNEQNNIPLVHAAVSVIQWNAGLLDSTNGYV